MNEHLFRSPQLFEFYQKNYSRLYVSRVIFDKQSGYPIPYKPNFIFDLHFSGLKPFFKDSIIQNLPLHNEECTLGTSAEGYSTVKLFYNEKTICYSLDYLKGILEKVLFFSSQKQYIIDIESENELFNFALFLSSRKEKNPFKEEQIMELVNQVWLNKESYLPIIDKRMSIVSEDFYDGKSTQSKINKPNLIRTELRKIKSAYNRQIIMDNLSDVIEKMEHGKQVINFSSISKEFLICMPQFSNANSIRNIIKNIMSVEENSTPHQLHLTGKGYYTGKMQLTGGRQKPAENRLNELITNLIKEGKPISISILIKAGQSKTTVEKYYKNYKTIIMEHNEKLNEEKKVKVLPDLRSEEQKIMEKKLETELAGTERVSYNAKQQVLYKHWMNIHYQVINLNDKHQREIWKGYFGKMQNTLNLTSNMTINEFYKCLNWYKSIGFTGQDLALMLDDALAKADKNVKIDTSAALSSHLLNYERTGTGFLGHNNR